MFRAYLAVLSLVLFAAAPSILLTEGVVVDGTGAPPKKADVRISGSRIAAVGHLQRTFGEQVIRVDGLVIAPGFIDAHSHADNAILSKPLAESQVRQGITTAIVGQDGGGNSPVSELIRKIETAKPAINFGLFAGHGAIRERIAPDSRGHASAAEVQAMQSALKGDMDSGTVGISSGLEYEPGKYASTEELVSLAQTAAASGGIYASHVRDEGNGAFASFGELIRIAREGRIPAHISHIKLATASVWGKARQAIDLVEKARRSGLDVTADIYPYLFWQSTITVLTLDPDWNNRNVWTKALLDVGGAERVVLTRYSPDKSWEGKSLAALAREQRRKPEDVILEIIRETHGERKGSESITCQAMQETDVRQFIKQPWVMFCSDGAIGGRHPRGAGAFPRVLAQYVRERKLLTLQEAVRKMTSLPAWRFSLPFRGQIAKGFYADIVVFNPRTIRDNSTPQKPTAVATGVRDVFVSGVPILLSGKLTGSRPGKVLLRTRDRPAARTGVAAISQSGRQ
jgi:N-acyl-D-amino-acid deacylase